MKSKALLSFLFVILGVVAGADAAMMVQVQVLETPAAAAPTTKPADIQLASITTNVGGDQTFSATAIVENRTIRLTGSLRRLDDGSYMVKVDFADETIDAAGFHSTTQTKTNTRASVDQPVTVAGFTGARGPGARRVVLTVSNEQPQ